MLPTYGASSTLSLSTTVNIGFILVLVSRGAQAGWENRPETVGTTRPSKVAVSARRASGSAGRRPNVTLPLLHAVPVIDVATNSILLNAVPFLDFAF